MKVEFLMISSPKLVANEPNELSWTVKYFSLTLMSIGWGPMGC